MEAAAIIPLPPEASLVGQELVLGQVHRQRRYPWSVLDGGRDPVGKGAALYPPTRAGSADDAVFGDLVPDFHRHHLPSFR